MSDTLKVPKLRFPEFSGKWKSKKYNEIYSFYSTNSFSREQLNYESGNVKNIHYGDIHTKFSTLFDIEKELVPFVNSEIDISKIQKENYCQAGDLLVADASEDYSDIGKTVEIVNLNKEKLLSGLHTFLARPDKHKMALGFSGYMLQNWNVRKQVMRIAQGTKVLGLATGRLGKVNLNIPPLPEQQKIASFLSSVDRKIALLQQKRTILEQYKKGVMQKLFNQQFRFKDEEGNEYQDWEERKFGDFVTNKTESYNPKKELENPMCIELEHLESDKGILSGYVEGNKQKSIKNKFEQGDVLFGKLRPYLRKYWLAKFDGVCTTEIWVLKSIENRALNSFIFYIIQTTGFSKLTEISSGSKMPRANWGVVSSGLFCLPSLKEQAKIVNFLSAIDNKIQLVANQLEKTQQFKKGLLQQLFV